MKIEGLSETMLIRWRRLAQVDVSVMQADTAVVELSRAVLVLLDVYLEQQRLIEVLAGKLDHDELGDVP